MPSPFNEDGPGESLPIDADPFADMDGRTSMEVLEAAANRYGLPLERLIVMAWKQTGPAPRRQNDRAPAWTYQTGARRT